MRTGALGGTGLASPTEALLSEQRLLGASGALANLARQFWGVARYPGGAWTPRKLFVNNPVGVWYDPSDITTLFQDSAGTVPVTEIGQPVGLVLDKSGNRNNLVQATATRRPTWQRDADGFAYLNFDGVDDAMALSSEALSTNGATAVIAMQQTAFQSSESLQTYFQAAVISAYTFDSVRDFSLGPRAAANSAGTIAASLYVENGSNGFETRSSQLLTLGVSYVITGSTASSASFVRVNGAQTNGTGSRNDVIVRAVAYDYAGKGVPVFNGRIYAIIWRGVEISGTDLTNAEAWVAAKSGVNIP